MVSLLVGGMMIRGLARRDGVKGLYKVDGYGKADGELQGMWKK